MRFLDLFTMSVNSLRRRKLRTALTVLGVIIGVASVVIMVSLGIGLNQLMLEMYSSYGDMTTITVYSKHYYGDSGSGDSEPDYLTDAVIEGFEGLEHVTGASPLLSAYVILKQGLYECSTEIIGASRQYLSSIPLGEGKLPEKEGELELIYGNCVIQWFHNSKSRDSYSSSGELPDVDFMNKPMFVIFDTNAYYLSQSGEANTKAPKKYMIHAAGVVKGSVNEFNNYSYSVYTDVDKLKAKLKQIYKKNPIPDQPTNKKGKPYPYFIYNQAVVFVDDMSNVTAVQQRISDMGYQANSQMQWIEQSQQTYDIIQLVLGGIGAISLFVAAIGIANTMMMSIYERTKEIGVIKVLGCDMGNIRNMFLMESGFIGFMGGVAGLIISYGVSYGMNHFLGIGQAMMGVEGDISRIPLWLSASAVVFAVFVGMAAGFFPALRAMRLSPLAAIRNE